MTKITFEQAKEQGFLKIYWNTEFKKAKNILKNANEKNIEELDCICFMELSHVDIEFMCYGIQNGKVDCGFYCCAEWEGIGWDSDGFADLEFNLDLLSSKENIEREMFNSLLRYINKHNLTWDKLN